MKKVFLGIAVLLVMYACARVPITNRKQLILISDAEMNAMAFASYKEFLDTNKVIPVNNSQTTMVKRVGDRIAKAAEQYFQAIGHPEYLEGYQWQTELVQSNQVNAWCMPGGKMVVYTGILPITQTEGGLAVVMGHEVSHAIAKHGAERMSEQMVAQGLLVGGQVALGVSMRDKPQQTQALWNTVFGAATVGTQLGLLAHSRNQESEADHLGLIFMSIAGYNPQEAVPFWQRMAAKAGGQKPPEFLSTHPSDETRISQIQGWMAEATDYYQKSGGGVRR
ncbi:MAG: M48 family metallopeptidase [Spirosomataceae bacterium]